MPATRVDSDSICGSLTAAALKIGRFHLEHAALGEEFARRAPACAARCCRAAERRVGRQLIARAMRPSDCPSRTVAPARSVRVPARAVRFEQQDHRRAHVEAAELGALLQRTSGGGSVGDHAPRRGRDVAGPNGGHAADVERADQHQRELPEGACRTGSARVRCARTAAAHAAPSTLLTLNRRPGTYTVSISSPRSGMCTR